MKNLFKEVYFNDALNAIFYKDDVYIVGLTVEVCDLNSFTY